MRPVLRLPLWAALASACTAASPDRGLHAAFQVPGAPFGPGAFPKREG